MKNIIIVALVIIAVVGGYWIGQSNAGMVAGDKASQDAIAMMKKQSESIKQIGEMMQSGGVTMREFGVKYKDDTMISRGKDMEVIAKKYMNENISASGSGAMKQMMNN